MEEYYGPVPMEKPSLFCQKRFDFLPSGCILEGKESA